MTNDSASRWIVLLSVVLLSGACSASASVASSRDASIRTQYVRMYVTVDQGNADREYADELDAAMQRELALRGVTVKTHIRRGIDLDERAVEQEIVAWKPDGVLILDFAGGGGSGSSLEDATYDVSLIDVAANRRIWRGRAHSARHLGTTRGMMKATAAEVAGRLTQDRLIGPVR